ncbi:MAG: mandelate racemase/muconate lactonizing enzyme family protein [Acidimicrobiia bacterium]
MTALPATLEAGRETMSFLFVRIDTDDGRSGTGEACDSYGCSYASVLAAVVEDVFAPLLVGRPVEAVEPLADRLRLITRRRLGDAWIAAQARSAVELALWDVVGRLHGRSVSAMIGRVRDEVEVYASSVFLEEGPASFHADLLAPLLARGVSKVKLRVGPDWATDLTTLGELRAMLDPTVQLMVDGSEIFTLPTALEVAEALHRIGVRWFEEPLPQSARAGIEALAAASRVPIAYGEHLFGTDEAIDAMRRGQLQVLQPDASTCGGLAEARRMAAAATSFGVRVVPHVCAGPISLAANLHLAATVPAIRLIEYPPSLADAWSTFGRGVDFGTDAITDGMLAVPSGPGLGVELDEQAVCHHPYRGPQARVAGTVGGLPDRFVGDR